MPRIIHRNARWSSQIRTWFVTSQDYQTHQLITKESNPFEPIRTGHNQHTHTGHNQHTHTDNTRQPELNSRVPRVHSPSRAQLKGHVPSSTEGTKQSHLWSITKSLIDHACRIQQLGLIAAKSPSGGHIPLWTTNFCNHHLVGQSTPPGRRAPGGYCFRRYRLEGPSPPPGATCSRTPLFLAIAWWSRLCHQTLYQYPYLY